MSLYIHTFCRQFSLFFFFLLTMIYFVDNVYRAEAIKFSSPLFSILLFLLKYCLLYRCSINPELVLIIRPFQNSYDFVVG